LTKAREDVELGDREPIVLERAVKLFRTALDNLPLSSAAVRANPGLLVACPVRGKDEELILEVLARAVRAEGHEVTFVDPEGLTERLTERPPAVVCLGSHGPGGRAPAVHV